MLRLKTLLAIAMWIFIAQDLPAQPHYNAWFRGTLSVPAGGKFKIDNELQHRRQNSFGNANLVNKNLMFTYRSWLHYQHNPAIKFSVSPFAYFSHYKIIQKQADEIAQPNTEIRFSAAIELQHQIFKRLYVVNRNALEHRAISNAQPDLTRTRTRLGIRYQLVEHMKLTAFDELFFNVSGTSNNHIFDQHRLGLTVEYCILPHLKFEVGYVHLIRQPLRGGKKINENNIIINLNFQLQRFIKSNI